MREVTLAQWNAAWSEHFGGCMYQSTELEETQHALIERNALGHSTHYEIVRIMCDGYPDMYGISYDGAITRMQQRYAKAEA